MKSKIDFDAFAERIIRLDDELLSALMDEPVQAEAEARRREAIAAELRAWIEN